MDLYQVGDYCLSCEERKRGKGELVFIFSLFANFLLKIDELGLLIKEGKT